MSENRATRINLNDGSVIAIVGNEAQLMFIKGVGKDPGGSLIWDYGNGMSDRFSTVSSQQMFASQFWNNPVAPEGSVFVRFVLEKNAITGYLGDQALISFPTKSQVAKALAKFAFEIAKACGMKTEAMKPMFAYPKEEAPAEKKPAKAEVEAEEVAA